MPEKPEPRYVELFKRLNSARPIHGPFHGLLNFYNRPYHYFVDRIPFLFDPKLEGVEFKFFTCKNNAFLDFDNPIIPGVKSS